MPPVPAPAHVNIADRLAEAAHRLNGRIALAAAVPGRAARPLPDRYATIRFGELDQQATTLARGLMELGAGPGKRIVLLVKPGIEFVTLVFALLRTGATMVLVDAGLGRKNIVDCLARTQPDGFVGIPLAHLLRMVYRRRFPAARTNVVVGNSWLSWLPDLPQVIERGRASRAALPKTAADDPAAIVFTSGSTGPPKGVTYSHGTFVAQLAEIERMYVLAPGEVDLACFPLFGLFNVALGITTVLPEMDFSRPASCDPAKLVNAANDWQVTQSFASPAVWNRLSTYCVAHGVTIPTLRKVLSCGATVPADVIARTLSIVHPLAELHTPYGATECLPVSTIDGRSVLTETAAATARGEGVCVGAKVESIAWRIVAIHDGPLTAADLQPLPQGEIGELVVSGPQVSQQYIATTDDERFNSLAKVRDGETIWHRTGDVGYFDLEQRFWYCGRKSQRVVTPSGTLFTECAEGVFNSHPAVAKSALVGVAGEAAIVVERNAVWASASDGELRQLATQHRATQQIKHFLLHPRLPVDIRHNSKIRREELAVWAAKQIARRRV